jgi:membrane-associated HD superfamily phosphohydrolase
MDTCYGWTTKEQTHKKKKPLAFQIMYSLIHAFNCNTTWIKLNDSYIVKYQFNPAATGILWITFDGLLLKIFTCFVVEICWHITIADITTCHASLFNALLLHSVPPVTIK